MEKFTWSDWVKKIVAIILGSLFLGVGINGFLVPHRLLDGGMIGLGLIVHYLSGVGTGLVIIIISIPIFLMAFFLYRSYFYYSVIGLMISSMFIDLFTPMYRFNYFSIGISSILGGFFVGSGIGIMLKHGISTGGMDLLALLISRVIHVNVGFIIFIFDFIIVVIGMLLIGTDRFYYTFLTIAIVFIATSLLTNKTTPH